jgi:hypothetical protein
VKARAGYKLRNDLLECGFRLSRIRSPRFHRLRLEARSALRPGECKFEPGKVGILIHDGSREVFAKSVTPKFSSSTSGALNALGSALTLGLVPMTAQAGATFPGVER